MFRNTTCNCDALLIGCLNCCPLSTFRQFCPLLSVDTYG
uniref:Uncharacterized protein n=1 Tax=Rhizophora mucronata TaxID=61149 RepID=A0A2P2P2F3_RHIMU